jgi:membrane protein YqaA with SNARE-associated domain
LRAILYSKARPVKLGFVETLLSPAASLGSLFAASFLAATLIPLSSEAALFAVLKLHADLFWPAVALATFGNTAGGMTTYLIGRCLGAKKPLTQLERMRRWGAPALALAWLPVVGDGFVLAAGWLKMNWLHAALWQAAGRLARYWVVAQATVA